MLIDFSFGNFRSFRDTQILSMQASELQKDDFLPENTIKLNDEKRLLKTALLYGANASGKTNLIKAVEFFRAVVLSSYKILEHNLLKSAVPFLLETGYDEKPIPFEITFIEKDNRYRYGYSISKGEIIEEWLYITNKRETPLFFREKQKIEYNKTSFSEAKLFVKSTQDDKGMNELERTAAHVPFVSVSAAFNGEHSLNVTNFINRINAISGIKDEELGAFTFSLINKDKDFRHFALKVLKNFNISDLRVREETFTSQLPLPEEDNVAIPKIEITENRMEVTVIKQMNHSEKLLEWPLNFESEGTRKIIHLLGPIYDTIKKHNVLFIDEFDSKFHTLLSKYLFQIFHCYSKASQLVVNVQDTNLMDTDVFRRDQIWFVDKDLIEQDSRLYSLSEYKIQKQKSYSENYLQGAFDAIPLFPDLNTVTRLMED
ncbi:AAA family ATPase [Neisseria animaloris]|uniref:AAA family ATPase n=1 Tax=Neisseria animaloris TaxID=326522 RepID=UPI00131BBB1B|nr:ATP-binding protein [Neisseria animaloris]